MNWLYVQGYEAIYWSMGTFSLSHPWSKLSTPYPETFRYQECFGKCLDFITFYSRIFIGFKLYRFCEDRHSYYEFSYMIKLPCLTNSVTLTSSINSGSLQSPDLLFNEKSWDSEARNVILMSHSEVNSPKQKTIIELRDILMHKSLHFRRNLW